MKNLVLSAAVLGAASLATACTSQGTASVTWDLQDWNDQTKTPVQANCPAGATTAAVYSLPAGEIDTTRATKDLFNCTDYGGRTGGLFSDNYQFWVNITDDSGAVLYAQSNRIDASISGGSTTSLGFQFQANRGYVEGSWSLVHSTGAPADCTGVSGIEFIDTNTATNNFVADQFNCTAGHGTTYPLPRATYNVSVEALGTVNGSPEQQIGQAALVQGVPVKFGNDVRNIGSVVITLDPGH